MIRFTRRRHCVALAALVLAAACSKSDKPPAVDTAAPAALRTAQPRGTPKVMPGALIKPIDQYSGDEFYDLVKKLTYTSKHDKQRNCKNSPGCGGSKKVSVVVEAVATQDSVGATNAPQYGVVYIKALNLGDAEEARYNIQPGKKFEYYVIVTATPAGAMQWQLEQLDTTPKARKITQVSSGVFEGCKHPWVAGAQANFKTCADTSTASMRGKTVRLGLKLQGDDDPMWASCAEGCCIAK